MSDGFDAARSAVVGVEGWLSDAQARRLHERAAALHAPGQVVEIGSYHGRSAIVLALAAAPGIEVVAIDPHAGNDRGPQEIESDRALGEADHAAFRANIERAGVAGVVRHVRRPSQDALGDVEGPIDLLYVDGAHRYRPASDDIRRWGERVRPGGTMLIHDSFSSVGVTAALVRLLFGGGGFRYVGRVGSLAEYRAQAPHGAGERVMNAARQVRELGWFARNVAIKVAITARLRRVARALGSETWPY